MANLAAFYETRNLFIQYTQFVKPLTFDQWKLVPQDHKAAVLFVQFFDQVCMAWNKYNKLEMVPAEDGVSTVLQYLEKNVAKILDEPARFTPAYIYRVAYNCMSCICWGEKMDNRLKETPCTVECDGAEVNLLDYAGYTTQSAEDSFELEELRNKIWSIIEDEGLEAEKVAKYLISGNEADLKKLNKRNRNYYRDNLSDIAVSIEEANRIASILKQKLSSIYEEMGQM